MIFYLRDLGLILSSFVESLIHEEMDPEERAFFYAHRTRNLHVKRIQMLTEHSGCADGQGGVLNIIRPYSVETESLQECEVNTIPITIEDVIHSIRLPNRAIRDGKNVWDSGQIDLCIDSRSRIETPYSEKRMRDVARILEDVSYYADPNMRDTDGSPLHVAKSRMNWFDEGRDYGIFVYYRLTNNARTPRDTNTVSMLPPPALGPDDITWSKAS